MAEGLAGVNMKKISAVSKYGGWIMRCEHRMGGASVFHVRQILL